MGEKLVTYLIRSIVVKNPVSDARIKLVVCAFLERNEGVLVHQESKSVSCSFCSILIHESYGNL